MFPRISLFFAIALFVAAVPLAASAGSFEAGRAAYLRGNYVIAAQRLLPLAKSGDPRAQAMVGFMHEHGHGFPQSWPAAAYWYRRAARQGDNTAQYMLGLLHDKGLGVPTDHVLAYAWLDLAVAGAPKRSRADYKRIRDAVASKMTREEILAAQFLALNKAMLFGY